MKDSFKVVAYLGAGHQQVWLGKAIKGFQRHGVQVVPTVRNEPVKCDLAIVWGTRKKGVIDYQVKNGGRTLVLERGYYRDRFVYTAFGLDGLNGEANFGNKGMDSARWEKHGVTLEDWRQEGKYILIAGQVPGDMSCAAVDLKKFYGGLVNHIRKLTDFPVKFKNHPMARTSLKPDGVEGTNEVEGAACIIAYSSNLVLDGVLKGIPGITYSPVSMAWDVTGHSFTGLEDLVRPVRNQWVYDLAYSQWTGDEIEKGKAWEHLRNVF